MTQKALDYLYDRAIKDNDEGLLNAFDDLKQALTPPEDMHDIKTKALELPTVYESGSVYQAEIYEDRLRLIDRLSHRIVRKGFVVVPEEPTGKMVDAGNEEVCQLYMCHCDSPKVYTAMIKAAQEGE